jgi:hypothetical protein
MPLMQNYVVCSRVSGRREIHSGQVSSHFLRDANFEQISSGFQYSIVGKRMSGLISENNELGGYPAFYGEARLRSSCNIRAYNATQLTAFLVRKASATKEIKPVY